MRQVVLLAGGRGLRLAPETDLRPKPMIHVGGRPMLRHLIELYTRHGAREFLIACGYKGEKIQKYFDGCAIRSATADRPFRVRTDAGPEVDVHAIDTGIETETGGRIRRLRSRLTDPTFAVTYGDGIGDIDLSALAAFHGRHGKIATVTAVHPPARFGALTLEGDRVSDFSEKAQTEQGWINGGFMIFSPGLLDLLEDDATILERGPLETLAARGELMAYRHAGFWLPMDTLREKLLLDSLCEQGDPPWR